MNVVKRWLKQIGIVLFLAVLAVVGVSFAADSGAWENRNGIVQALLDKVSGGSMAVTDRYASLEHEPETIRREAERLVAGMTDRQKIGQLMIIGFQGTELDQDSTYMLTEYPVGNVILFDRNMESSQQVKKLNAAVTDLVFSRQGVIPLICVDQEGGLVARMPGGLPALPAAEEIGKMDVTQAERLARDTGKALREIGFNVNLAPVADLGMTDKRSYGNEPEQVARYAAATIRGYSGTAIMTALKHFPGIGQVKTDPHIDGDIVSLSKEELRIRDGKPFYELIGKTTPDETMVMVTNVTFPKLDPEAPACLSKAVMADLLREEYGFKGLVVVDDLEMGAMSKHYSFRDMGVRAIAAGADLLLVCHEYSHEQEVYNGLLEAYRTGRLDKKAVDGKVRRIIEVKLRLAKRLKEAA